MLSWRHFFTAVMLAVSVVVGSKAAAPSGATPTWKLAWSTTFPVSVPLGGFSQCGNNPNSRQAFCAGLPASLRSQWWAYPQGWPDTASERHYTVGGYYDPASTLWISHRMLHIRLWRGTGAVHSAAVVPKAAMGVRYGKFVERWRVVKATTGYKSAHLLWPVRNAPTEVDFPENDWDTQPFAYVHYGVAGQLSYDSGVSWKGWHTTAIVWTPHYLAFYMDGREIGRTTVGVPHVSMTWVLQNETSLDGETPPLHSSAQMDISYVAVYRLH